jgi:hypothetical protein
MPIVKQVDCDGDYEGVVAFIHADPRYLKGPNCWDECVSGETYSGELHRRPLDASGKAFLYCQHKHRSIDAAVSCVKKMMRVVSKR